MSRIYDLELTAMTGGEKMLVNAFDIAAVLPVRGGSQIVLNVPVAATRTLGGEHVEPYTLNVKEDVAALKNMRIQAARFPCE